MHLPTINRRSLFIASAAVLVILGVGIGLFFAKDYLWPAPQQAVVGEPVDIVLDFYEPWLAAKQSTSTDPYKAGLTKAPVLGREVRQQILKAKKSAADFDPVLCHSRTPVELSARLVSTTEEQAEVLVVARDKEQPEQSIVTLTRLGEGWYISGITCSPGEFGPEREFSFDREGYLLKSVVPPLNPAYWHLVFVENGEPGHAVPLFFSTESTCTTLTGAQSVCDPLQFIEPSKAHVQGEMTETGVKVRHLELVKE